MSDFFSQLASILSPVLLIVAVAVAAWGALNRENLKTLRESNKDLADRVQILESAEIRLTAEAKELRSENDTLRSVITNEAHLVAIEGQLIDHHKQAEAWWRDTTVLLTSIRDSLQEDAQ